MYSGTRSTFKMNENKPIYFTRDLARSIGKERRLLDFMLAEDDPEFNEEGWRVTWITKPNPVARQVEFNSASAKVMFVLKYGTGKR